MEKIYEIYNKIWAFVLDVLAKFGIEAKLENVPGIFLPKDAE